MLEGKNAIVTGGSLGIGTAIALDLARNGANVAINYRRHDKEAKDVVAQIEKMGRKGLAVKADVSSFDDARKMVAEVKDNFGGIDILVCNAGINRDSVIWKMEEKQWDEVMATDLKGTFNYCRAVAPLFREQKSGRIVNIASINALRGKFGQTNYSAAKAGVVGLSKALAKELGRSNVNVNVVCPGMIGTEMMAKIPEEFKQKARDEAVLGRIGEPEDVAAVVSFLCSEGARHITGEVIKVDGGQYI